MTVTITSKGQVTIPKKVRDHLQLKAGSAVDFELAPDGRIVLITAPPAGQKRSRFARIRGTASVHMRTEDIMALTRGE